MKTYAETYAMRSRHYQLLGKIGKLMADAFTEGDVENQRDIAAHAQKAMVHYLIEQRGYTLGDLATALIKP